MNDTPADLQNTLKPKLVEKGIEVFEDLDTFLDWLNEPNSELSGATPMSIALEPDGENKILDILQRIEKQDKLTRFGLATVILATTFFVAWHMINVVGLPARNVIGIALFAVGTFSCILAWDQIETLLHSNEEQAKTEISKKDLEFKERGIKSLALGTLFCLGWWLLTNDLADSLVTSCLISALAFWVFKEDDNTKE